MFNGSENRKKNLRNKNSVLFSILTKSKLKESVSITIITISDITKYFHPVSNGCSAWSFKRPNALRSITIERNENIIKINMRNSFIICICFLHCCLCYPRTREGEIVRTMLSFRENFIYNCDIYWICWLYTTKNIAIIVTKKSSILHNVSFLLRMVPSTFLPYFSYTEILELYCDHTY